MSVSLWVQSGGPSYSGRGSAFSSLFSCSYPWLRACDRRSGCWRSTLARSTRVIGLELGGSCQAFIDRFGFEAAAIRAIVLRLGIRSEKPADAFGEEALRR